MKQPFRGGIFRTGPMVSYRGTAVGTRGNFPAQLDEIQGRNVAWTGSSMEATSVTCRCVSFHGMSPIHTFPFLFWVWLEIKYELKRQKPAQESVCLALTDPNGVNCLGHVCSRFLLYPLSLAPKPTSRLEDAKPDTLTAAKWPCNCFRAHASSRSQAFGGVRAARQVAPIKARDVMRIFHMRLGSINSANEGRRQERKRTDVERLCTGSEPGSVGKLGMMMYSYVDDGGLEKLGRPSGSLPSNQGREICPRLPENHGIKCGSDSFVEVELGSLHHAIGEGPGARIARKQSIELTWTREL
ncbi:hypothetical protein V8F06_003812 [Rhypophila decipiens]